MLSLASSDRSSSLLLSDDSIVLFDVPIVSSEIVYNGAKRVGFDLGVVVLNVDILSEGHLVGGNGDVLGVEKGDCLNARDWMESDSTNTVGTWRTCRRENSPNTALMFLIRQSFFVIVKTEFDCELSILRFACCSKA